ncbi:MAG: hypothetical protein E6J65_19125 [Deltaproteobacteria bacterium]|nr:MAG: hypothetical protein E6J65_19125 [Deltaproteobacteria bacterium]
MLFAVLLAASAAADPRPISDWRQRALLAVNEEAVGTNADTPPETGRNGKIAHAPVEKAARGATVVIKAQVQDPSRLFAPLVFARRSGNERYEAFTMRDRGPSASDRRGSRSRASPSIPRPSLSR